MLDTMMSKADTHVHTFYSGTTGYGPLRFPESITSPEEQVDNARKNGMSVVCITDHSEIKGAFKAAEYGKRFDDIDVVVGDEIMTADGEIIGLWLNDFIKPEMTAEETMDEIRSQGGIAIAPHPFSFYVRCLRDKVFELDLDGIETINGGHPDPWTNSTAQKVWEDNPGKWAQISGSDAHSPITSNYNWTEFPGQGAEDFRKAILNRTTVACGVPAPEFTQVQWSLQVVTQGQLYILKAMAGKLDPEDPNPLAQKAMKISTPKKIAGLIGGAIYCTPPGPFIGEFLATHWLKKQAKMLQAKYEEDHDLAGKCLTQSTR